MFGLRLRLLPPAVKPLLIHILLDDLFQSRCEISASLLDISLIVRYQPRCDISLVVISAIFVVCNELSCLESV